MPHTSHDTTRSPHVQAESQADDWSREVVPRLPQRFEEQAKALKAFERSRQIGSASDLLRGLLAYMYTVHSFQHLSLWSVLIGLADVSATDWRKRLQRAAVWGQWLLQEVLASASAVAPWVAREGVRRILLIDGTHLKCRGPQGLVWRVHTAFDLLVAVRLSAGQREAAQRKKKRTASSGVRSRWRPCIKRAGTSQETSPLYAGLPLAWHPSDRW